MHDKKAVRYIANVVFRIVGYKVMVNKVTFSGFTGVDHPNLPPWIRP